MLRLDVLTRGNFQYFRRLSGLDKMAALHASLTGLPDEILEHILDYLAHDTGRLITIDQRASLSIESFASGPSKSEADKNVISNFRSVCKRFLNLSTNRHFARVRIRFSSEGFDRIRFVLERPHLAREVRKVSYMVHHFYPQNKPRLEQLLEEARTTTAECLQRYEGGQCSLQANGNRPSIRRLLADLDRSLQHEKIIIAAIARADDQRQIIQGQVDEQTLVAALTAFENLQQIRLMRNNDADDQAWFGFLKSRPALYAEFRPSEWAVACEHATKTLGRAYLASGCKAHRLSSRNMDPQSALLLTHSSQAAISSLATRLTCLELEFHDPTDLNERMLQLSAVFRALFTAAVKIQGLHLSFVASISISLETIFHHVQWKDLRYIGFSSWNLPTNEIIDVLRRHRKSLRSVRLRGVRLREGKWMEILKVLRQELKLKWVSLRQVGYFPRIGGGPTAVPGGMGFGGLRRPPDDDEDSDSYKSDETIDWEREVLEDESAGPSDGESDRSPSNNSESGGHSTEDDNGNEDDEWAHVGMDNETTQPVEVKYSDHSVSGGSVSEGNLGDAAESPPRSIAGESDFGAVNDLAIDDQIMVYHSSATDDPLPNCDCRNGFAWDDLEDDHGLDPTKLEWKRWEKWVVKRCLIHDPPAP